MTLLNHIGVYCIMLLVCFVIAIFSEDIKEDMILSPLVATFFFVIFEAFYWTIKIFF